MIIEINNPKLEIEIMKKDCDNCKHWAQPTTAEPCFSCSGRPLYNKWEPIE